MSLRNEIYSLIAGAVFLLSGIAKAIDISVFQNAIVQYGFANLQFVAPLIVLAEVAVGLLLIFQIRQNRTAAAGTILVVCFTAVYAYGLAFKGVEDCGCFGKISMLNTSPWLTFVRNAILLYLLITLWVKGDKSGRFNKIFWLAAVVFIGIVAFMTGYTYSGGSTNKHKYIPKPIDRTALKDFVTLSKDSTYLVFAFSYTCPHCLNSMANLKEYVPAGVVDRVIGLALGDSTMEQKFRRNFNPDFTITSHKSDLLRLTNNFPTAYFIRNDSVMMQLSGELPCAYVFTATMQP